MNEIEQIKKNVANAALEMVQEGMVIGLGTGSTAKYFIEGLGDRVRQGLKIRGAPTSNESLKQAIDLKIPLISINRIEKLDLDVDGADQCDPQLALIKGRGGALLREKIVAYASSKMVVIVDESKFVEKLGKGLLPLEVVPIAAELLRRQLKQKGFDSALRMKSNGTAYLTDNQNHILDVELKELVDNPSQLDAEFQAMPGVVETGFFLNLATTLLIGCADGSIKTLSKEKV